MSDTVDVIMAAYPSTGPAELDFDALVSLVKAKTVRSEGVILVSRDGDGRVTVSQTGDHLGRKGLGWGGGVGLVVGLFAPPLLASVVVGAAARRPDRQVHQAPGHTGLEADLGDKLQPGYRGGDRGRRRRGPAGRRAGAGRRVGDVGGAHGLPGLRT